MFDERTALKLRLEQMQDAEERLLREFQKERAFIFSRLRELDREEGLKTAAKEEETQYLPPAKNYLEAPGDNSEHNSSPSRRARPSRRSKTTKMRDTAISILKAQSAPIRGIELKREIEEQTGLQIANMTTFMNTITKADPNIIKIGRGLYTYSREPQESKTIFLGTDEMNEAPSNEP